MSPSVLHVQLDAYLSIRESPRRDACHMSHQTKVIAT